jgi:hypothetical protein
MSASPASDTPLQDALLAEVRELTRAHGSRKQLAEHLSIPLPRLSEYLADPPVRRPNGETTLALQAWAKQAKRNLPKA